MGRIVMDPSPPRRELATWKEIGAHLGVTDRAAQMWERQRGMPVHRLPGPGRGRVIAYTDELDAWKLQGGSVPEPVIEAPARSTWWRSAVVVAVGLLALLGVAGALRVRPMPHAAELQGEVLIVRDKAGKELWRKVFPDMHRDWPRRTVQLADLNSDQAPEILVAHRRQPDDELICFNAGGDLLWRYKPGKPVKSSRRSYENHYGIHTFVAAKVGLENRMRVVVSGFHRPLSPAQVSLLDEKGRVEREYWHPGHLNDVSVGDLDGDGRNEIYLAGVNNVMGAATVVVLDADRFQGSAADEKGRPHFADMPISPEMRRVLLPRTEMNRACFPHNVTTWLGVNAKGIRVDVNENPLMYYGAPVIVYSMSADLRILDVTFTDAFRSANRNPCGLRHPPPLEGVAELRNVISLTPPPR